MPVILLHLLVILGITALYTLVTAVPGKLFRKNKAA
jgi:hypothetical protein